MSGLSSSACWQMLHFVCVQQQQEQHQANIHTSLSICREPVKLFLACAQTHPGGKYSTTPCFTGNLPKSPSLPSGVFSAAMQCRWNLIITKSTVERQWGSCDSDCQSSNQTICEWFVGAAASAHWGGTRKEYHQGKMEEERAAPHTMCFTHMHAPGHITSLCTPRSRRNLLQHSFHSLLGNLSSLRNTTHILYRIYM